MRTLLVFLALALAFAGCRKDLADLSLPTPKKLSAFHKEALKHVPEEAALIATADVGWLLRLGVDWNFGMFPVAPKDGRLPDLWKELSKASTEAFGADITAVERVALWVSLKPDDAVLFVEGHMGALRHEGTSRDHNGHTVVKLARHLWGADVPGGVLIGTTHGVDLTLDVADGKHASLASKSRLATPHAKALALAGDGMMLVTASFLQYAGQGFDHPMLSLDALVGRVGADASLTVVATGKKKALDWLDKQWAHPFHRAHDALERERLNEEKRGGPLAAILLRAGLVKLDELATLTRPKRAGSKMTWHIDTPGAWAAPILFVVGFAKADEGAFGSSESSESDRAVLAMVAQFADEVCACATSDCVTEATQRFQAQSARFKDMKPGKDAEAAMRPALDRMVKCIANITNKRTP